MGILGRVVVVVVVVGRDMARDMVGGIGGERASDGLVTKSPIGSILCNQRVALFMHNICTTFLTSMFADHLVPNPRPIAKSYLPRLFQWQWTAVHVAWLALFIEYHRLGSIRPSLITQSLGWTRVGSDSRPVKTSPLSPSPWL